ncbi:MAG: uroporphyrinogen-III C-methyltransferase [Nitrospira sp.]|nr:uroporphyrinogen-III C-methyltransferase [Nitrospira sp.]
MTAPRLNGKVYLVGAGPGDPKLLTLRGKECLEQADVVLYDYLANPAILTHVSDQAERLYVGRRGKGKYPAQDEINRLLIERAQEGKTVVRLKGGDPFVFGRGGEEAEVLASAGIEFEVVPGVTAAVAAPAYAGIPVTHRTLASTVTFVTGHEDPDKPSTGVEWPRLATSHGTLVFLMGMKNLPAIVANLTAEGRSSTTPAAVIRWGTRAAQQTVVGTLADIVGKTEAAKMEPPTVIVVGDVVRLREQLNWFERRPLFGKRVLMTRAKEQAAELADLLAAYGAEPVEAPTIRIVPPEDWTAVDRAISSISSATQWARFSICASRFSFSRFSSSARELLPDDVRARGAHVDVVTVYRTITPSEDRAEWCRQLSDRQIHVVTFTSSSTVRNFVTMLGGVERVRPLLQSVLVACIGPITARTAEEFGLTVSIVPEENTIPALVDAIVRHYDAGRRKQVMAGTA